MLRSILIASLAAVCALSAGCAKRGRTRAPSAPVAVVPGTQEEGIASWYGNPYHGRRAASGEIYDMEQLTAAHRTLPFHTWVRVTNLTNNREVDVRITDRGPFVDGRIIDLSLAAAREIDMVRAGIAKVRLLVIDPPANVSSVSAIEAAPGVPYAVQAGAFADQSRAIAVRDSLRRPDVRLVELNRDPKLWRVIVGRALSLDQATQLANEIALVTGQAFVVREPEAGD